MEEAPLSPVKKRASAYFGWYAGIILIIVSFGVGILVGEGLYIQKASANPDGSANIEKVINLNRNLNHSDSVDFAQFWEVWDRVKAQYVKQPVKDTDLLYGAMEGMVAGLNDPYSLYLPPDQAQDFSKSLSGELSGIGAEVGIKQKQLVVVRPVPGSPAEKAGLMKGDRILAIDKLPTDNMDIATAVDHIRGPATSSVELSIMRDGWSKPKDFTIHRATISVPPVSMEMKPGNIAYIRVMQFNEQTIPEFSQYVSQLNEQNTKGLILDLRDNPGGYLDGAISMASEWVSDGPVVSERYSDGKVDEHDALSIPHHLTKIPTIVLVNGGTASAAEIVSGALQDHKLATIVGEKTFGKGSVQDFEDFPDGSALKITVAEWLTPKGNNINKTGITPDVVVKEDYANEKVDQDVMVDKAMELLNKK